MITVGIYGGIGSGKSTVANIISSLGGLVISADEENRALLKDKAYLDKLEISFPEAFENGVLNKGKLRGLIFENADKRKLLNSISHPLIISRIQAKLVEPISFIELPVFVEGLKNDYNILVVSSRATQISRVIRRDNRSEEEIEKTIEAQDYLKNIPCPIIINNDGNLEELHKEVTIVYNKILQSSL